MRTRLWFGIGIAASMLWLLFSFHASVNLMAHGTNGSLIKWMACMHDTPDDAAGCKERLKTDSAAEINHRWFLIGERTFGPLAAGWLLGFGLIALGRRTKAR